MVTNRKKSGGHGSGQKHKTFYSCQRDLLVQRRYLIMVFYFISVFYHQIKKILKSIVVWVFDNFFHTKSVKF